MNIDSKKIKALIYSIILSVIGYLAFVVWAGWREVVDASIKIGLVWLLVALGLSLVNYLLRFIRWHYYLNILQYRVPIIDDLRIYILGFSLTTTPGKAGELLRGVFLKAYQVDYRATISLFFTERLSDMIAIMLFVVLGVYTGLEMESVFIWVGLLIITLILILQQNKLFSRLQTKLQEKQSRFYLFINHVFDIVLHSGKLLRITPLSSGIALGLISWGAEGLAFYLLVQQLGVDISLEVALYIYALSMLVGALSFLPGGLGSAELTMMFLLMQHGLNEAESTAVTVLTRFATLWFAVILGALALWRQGKYTAVEKA